MLYDIINAIKLFFKQNFLCNHAYSTKVVKVGLQSFEVGTCKKCERVRVKEI